MNRKFVFYLFGRIGQTVGALLLLPMFVALIYGESIPFVSFLGTSLGAIGLGAIITRLCKTSNNVIYAKEGFAIVALAWLGTSAFGALPFWISGEIPSYIDAFFETVSGFTTTGASILTNVEALSKSMLFWRSFTHWIGGMGVLVFVMAIASNITDRSIHIMRAEMPGHVVGKLVPRAKDTAKILYLIYIVMTVAEIILLIAVGMPVFDSILHGFGTAGTGGFGIKADSIGGYSSYCQIVIAVFMLLFGVNFNIYYLLIIGKLRTLFKSTELWAYLGIAAASVAVIANNIYSIYENAADSLRHSLFQVSSIMTTTGFSTADFDLWPGLSKGILIVLMCIGACSGSTAGGIKISRIVILFKLIAREIKRLIHPRSVSSVKFEDKPLDDQTLNSVATYIAIYLFCLVTVFLIVCREPFGFETNFSAVIATFNNIGPGFGRVGATGSFAAYSDLSKLVFSGAMLLGRLEIFPLIIALSPSTWKKTR
ncbi:MAG: TrkH family potassium uptake protein [Ruminococcaceae bacterium]|nr:TrkH family potassium uptake protein [Oscillospiraceae bacterium]